MTDARKKEAPKAGTAQCVKVTAIIALVLVLLVVVMLVSGRDGHGPDRHTLQGDGSGSHTGPPPGVSRTHA